MRLKHGRTSSDHICLVTVVLESLSGHVDVQSIQPWVKKLTLQPDEIE